MTLTLRPATPADGDDIARLCWAYRDLLVERSADMPPIVETYYSKESYAVLIADLPRIHARPKGDIVLATINDAVVGCAMYYPLAIPGVTEIKRVFVDPAARGTGAGRALIEDCMTRARADGYNRMVLDTMIHLTEAIGLYERLGFQPCPPFYEPEVQFEPYLRFFDHPL
ncbi:GNAT family N-acetyltransferase [uncultured Tateyamaria sp.]|uniref:GNAT family N-acetyltransferase n=1 Tax=uncultured Tateyamaria sp. TaxID=455651 RepID=UPI002618B057|nr:GNAT family N-acetyltransferase [uncultured Tateyamaria sp.]